MRLFGERLVKVPEAWISIRLYKNRAKASTETYYNYKHVSLEPADRRHPDQRRRLAAQTYRPVADLWHVPAGLPLRANKNFKIYLNFLYGSNLAATISLTSVKYAQCLAIEPLYTCRHGHLASAPCSSANSERVAWLATIAFRNFENIWATLEVFSSLIDPGEDRSLPA